MRSWTFMLFGKTIMKRSIIFFTLLFLGIISGNAQRDHSVELSMSSGYVIPVTSMTFSDYWKMKYGGGVRAGIPLSQSVILLGSFEYYQFKMNENGVKKGFDANHMRDIWLFDQVSLNPTAGPSSVTTGAIDMRVSPSGVPGFLSPYLIGGVGVMHFSLGKINLRPTSVLPIDSSNIIMTAEQIITGGTTTTMFFELGVGIDFRLAESYDLFLEARYTNGNNKIRVGYLPLTAGIRIHL